MAVAREIRTPDLTPKETCMLSRGFAAWRRIVLSLLAVLALGAAPALAQQEEIDIDTFYRELEPHGRWVTHPRYGGVWVPSVDRDWRPYTRGQWVHTEEHGWYWESEEPFGWAVFHYGRWLYDPDEGWVWVPGTEWGPAWVAWRYGEEDVGWAPLPPDAEWRGGEIVYTSRFYDAPSFSPAWCFVPVALLATPRVWTRIVPPRRNVYFLSRTRFVTGYRASRYGVFNAGLDRGHYRRVTGRDVPVRRIVLSERPGRGIGGSEVRVYRPRVRAIGAPGTWRPPTERGGVWRGRDDGSRGGPGFENRQPIPPRGRGDEGRDGGPGFENRQPIPPRGRGDEGRGGAPGFENRQPIPPRGRGDEGRGGAPGFENRQPLPPRGRGDEGRDGGPGFENRQPIPPRGRGDEGRGGGPGFENRQPLPPRGRGDEGRGGAPGFENRQPLPPRGRGDEGRGGAPGFENRQPLPPRGRGDEGRGGAPGFENRQPGPPRGEERPAPRERGDQPRRDGPGIGETPGQSLR
jgi:hypothetical protein